MSARRQAASLQLALVPDRALARLSALLCALAAAALLAALASQSSVHQPPWLPPWQWWVLAALLLPLSAWLGARLPDRRGRRLRWDGEAWWLLRGDRAQEEEVGVQVSMDFGTWLLLRLRPTVGLGVLRPRYLALSRADHAPQWPALRATLYTARPRQPPA